MPTIKILDAGFVNALKMYAPIVNPITVPTGTVRSIIREGHRVIEYNERGKGVVLTLENYMDPHRFDEPKKEEEKPVETPVTNPYGKDVSIDTEAAVFTGYTKNTAMEMEPPKAPATAETATEATSEYPAKLTKAQKKAIAKARREEEAAKAVEAATAEASTEVIE